MPKLSNCWSWIAGLCCVLSAGRAIAAEPEPAAVARPAVPLTAADWRSDLVFARSEMSRRHVNLFHTLSPAAYGTAFQRLLADVDHLTEHEIIVRLAEIVASVGDGHSRLTLPLDPSAGFFSGHTGTAASRTATFRQLPLRLTRTSEGYVVSRADEQLADLLGARVSSIDGRDPVAAETLLEPIVNRDNAHQLYDLLPRFMVVPEVLHARGVSRSPDQVRWQFIDQSGQSRSVILRPVAVGITPNWKALPAVDWPAGFADRKAASLWFADIADPDAVYLRVAEIADMPGQTFAAFAEAVETHLATTGRRRVLVDLRGNPGGDNSLNAALVRALIATPWIREPGALFVLIDGGTFSAAMNLAEDLEHWLPAVFVGSGTGARPNSYGDARKLVLPQSGLTLRLSSLYWQNHPEDQRAAIEPLIHVPLTADGLRTGSDPLGTTLRTLDEATPAPMGQWQGMLAVEFRHVPVELAIAGLDGADAGSVSIRDLGVESAPVSLGTWNGPEWRAEIYLPSGPVPIAARAGGERLTGWINYRGNRYPFVLTRP